jgi:hypothetical protein
MMMTVVVMRNRLQVNGWRVLGAHHVEVVSRLRAVAAPVRLVCARRRASVAPRPAPRLAVCTLPYFFMTKNLCGAQDAVQNYFIIISLLISPLVGHRPSLWIKHKENGQ